MTSIVSRVWTSAHAQPSPSSNYHYNPTFGLFDLVSSPVWWEAETNISLFSFFFWHYKITLMQSWINIYIVLHYDFALKKERNRRYPTETIMDADYTDDIALLANTPTQVESRLHRLEQAAGCISLYVNADKTKYMCFTQERDISTLNGGSLKLVNKFTYLGSRVLSTESDISMCLSKAWTVIDSYRLSIIWKSDLSDKIKYNFFQAVVVSIQLYGCTIWALIKCIEKKLDGNSSRMLQAILNKSWKQHPMKQQLYGHLPLISKIIQIRWTRHTGHCWRNKNKLISDVL